MRAATEGNPPLVKPQGDLVQVLGREVRRQGNRSWRAPLPARGGHHIKQQRGSQMRPWTRPPLLTYLLMDMSVAPKKSRARQWNKKKKQENDAENKKKKGKKIDFSNLRNPPTILRHFHHTKQQDTNNERIQGGRLVHTPKQQQSART